MPCPSPDSSTHQKLPKRMKQDQDKSTAKKKSKFSKSDDIQNHVINSTQDLEKTSQIEPGRRKKQNKNVKSRLKSKLKQLKLTLYDPILELKEIEQDYAEWREENMVFGLQSLSQHVHDRKLLGKEVFRLINKKEFKSLLPRNLKKYKVQDVRNWCLQDMKMASEQRILAILNDEDYYSSSPSETQIFKEDTLKSDLSVQEENHEASRHEASVAEFGSKEISNDDAVNDSHGYSLKSNSSNIDSKKEDGTIDENSANDATSISFIPEQHDADVFQEIIKTPDQKDMDELLNSDLVINSEEIGDKPAVQEEKTEQDKSLLILEMEMRARALKSFIKAQEMKKKS